MKKLICDKCGKAITSGHWEINTHSVGDNGIYSLSIDNFAEFDLCPDCWEAFKRFMGYKNHDGQVAVKIDCF